MNTTRTTRENLLLIIAGVLIVSVLYSVWRWNPRGGASGSRWAQIKALREEAASAAGELNKLNTTMPKVSQDPAKLSQTLAGLNVTNAALQVQYLFKQQQFPNDDLARQQQNVEIAELAWKHGVVVVSAGPEPTTANDLTSITRPVAPIEPSSEAPTAPAKAANEKSASQAEMVVGPFVDRRKLAQELRRPIEQLVVGGPFHAQRKFLQALESLEPGVCVLHVVIERLKATEDVPEGTLRTTLLLVQ